jgi:predicted MPP superfamily phosphohydrolase
LAGVGPAVPRILLCHNPDYAESMPADTRVDLMLAGHTHGGQVSLPLIGSPILPIRHRQYAAGLVQGPRCPVYVSRGLGTTRPFHPPQLPARSGDHHIACGRSVASGQQAGAGSP